MNSTTWALSTTGPERPALQSSGDRFPVAGAVPVEPPKKEQAVGIHVVGHCVQPLFRLLDQSLVVQGEAQTGQAIKPVSASFVGPAAFVPKESFAGHLVVGRPGPLELIVVLVHVAGVTVARSQPAGSTAPGGSGRNAGWVGGSKGRA